MEWVGRVGQATKQGDWWQKWQRELGSIKCYQSITGVNDYILKTFDVQLDFAQYTRAHKVLMNFILSRPIFCTSTEVYSHDYMLTQFCTI